MEDIFSGQIFTNTIHLHNINQVNHIGFTVANYEVTYILRDMSKETQARGGKEKA